MSAQSDQLERGTAAPEGDSSEVRATVGRPFTLILRPTIQTSATPDVHVFATLDGQRVAWSAQIEQAETGAIRVVTTPSSLGRGQLTVVLVPRGQSFTEQPRVELTFAMIETVLSGRERWPPAEQWFATATHSIDQLHAVEGDYLRHLRARAADQIKASERSLLIDAGIALAAALALIFFAASAVMSLLRALNVLVTHIEHTVSTQDFANRIRVQQKDEMGELSHSFNELMSIADHLIKEKDYFASTDLLTGAYNRYRFGELFRIELQRVERYGGGLSLIMFDIDHFKKVNDRFGHATGDLVLKEVAQLVRKLIRANDVLVRWGGEEFMILVPHTGEQAAELAEKLCLAVERHASHHLPAIPASFGVSSYVRDDTLESLYARTDEALYRAKNQGRNRVRAVFAESAVAVPSYA